MKIHQRFPKINILWLLDGVGSYDGDDNALGEGSDQHGTDNMSYDNEEESSSLPTMDEQASSRFYQGELFAENAVFAPESTVTLKNRKEMPLQTPQKAPYLSETQMEYARKSLQRKIVEIKIFFDDGTYETFRPQGVEVQTLLFLSTQRCEYAFLANCLDGGWGVWYIAIENLVNSFVQQLFELVVIDAKVIYGMVSNGDLRLKRFV